MTSAALASLHLPLGNQNSRRKHHPGRARPRAGPSMSQRGPHSTVHGGGPGTERLPPAAVRSPAEQCWPSRGGGCLLSAFRAVSPQPVPREPHENPAADGPQGEHPTRGRDSFFPSRFFQSLDSKCWRSRAGRSGPRAISRDVSVPAAPSNSALRLRGLRREAHALALFTPFILIRHLERRQ